MKSFDLFKATPFLSFDGKTQISSAFGRIATWVMVFILISLIVLFGKELVLKQAPIITQNRIQGAVKDSLTFTADQFVFGFGNLTTNRHYIDDSVYTMRILKLGTGKGYYKEIKLVPCEADPKEIAPGMARCVDPDPENMKLLTTNKMAVDMFSLMVFRCDNLTSKVPCKDSATIDRMMAVSFVTYTVKYKSLQSNNYLNPFSESAESKTLSILPMSSALLKIITLNMKTIQVITDRGALFSEEYSEKGISLDLTEMTVGSSMGVNGAFCIIHAVNSGMLEVITRRYTKLQDVLANIGGIMNTMLILIGFVAIRYSRFQMKEKLSNEAFTLDYKQQEVSFKAIRDSRRHKTMAKKNRRFSSRVYPMGSQNLSENPYHQSFSKIDRNGSANQEELSKASTNELNEARSPTSLLKIESESPIKDKSHQGNEESLQADHSSMVPIAQFKSEAAVLPINENEESNENDDSKLDIELGNNHNIHPSFWEWLCSPFKKSKRVNQIEAAHSKIERVIDVLFIMKKLTQFERLAHLIFSENQKIIFDNLPRPAMHLHSSAKSFTGCDPELLKKALKNVMDIENPTQLDEKLLQLYESG